MIVARGSLPAVRALGRRTSLPAVALLLLLALGTAVATVTWGPLALGGLGVAVVVAVLLFRLDLAVALLVGTFFFTAYLNHGAGVVTIDKGIGALAVVAWGLEWTVNRRQVLRSAQLWLIVGLLVWTAVSVSGAENDKAALVTSLRYLIFGTLYFLVLQTVRGDRRRAEVLVSVVVLSAAAASVVGLAEFFGHDVARASGPVMDPNDFGFLLASTLPLAIYQLHWRDLRLGRIVSAVCLVLILACTIATFSRSALAGLAAASIWALWTGRPRLPRGSCLPGLP